MSVGASAYSSPRQLAFEFVRAQPSPAKQVSDNLYFAVLPDADVARRMVGISAELRERFGLKGKSRSAELLHITLAPVGSADCLSDAAVANAICAGSMIRFDPIEVTFDRAMSFNGGSRWAQVLRCKSGGVELADLRKMLGLSLWFAGLDYRLARGFAPHVTLLYDRARIPETALTKPLTWTVRELVLVRSLYGQGRHIHLGRWPLCG